MTICRRRPARAPRRHFGEAHGVVHVTTCSAGTPQRLMTMLREGSTPRHAVGGVHARTPDGVGLRVDVLAAAVELRGVHMHHERLCRIRA